MPESTTAPGYISLMPGLEVDREITPSKVCSVRVFNVTARPIYIPSRTPIVATIGTMGFDNLIGGTWLEKANEEHQRIFDDEHHYHPKSASYNNNVSLRNREVNHIDQKPRLSHAKPGSKAESNQISNVPGVNVQRKFSSI